VRREPAGHGPETLDDLEGVVLDASETAHDAPNHSDCAFGGGVPSRGMGWERGEYLPNRWLDLASSTWWEWQEHRQRALEHAQAVEVSGHDATGEAEQPNA
jgi:hypothetical protein